MIKRVMRFVLGPALVAGVFSIVGCESAPEAQPKLVWQENGIPRHNDANRPDWHYTFVYHPDAQVYYEPYSQTYWWYEAGQWWPGSEPPGRLRLDPKRAVVIGSFYEQPFRNHALTLASHPCRSSMPPMFDPRPELMYRFENARIASHTEE